MALPESPSLGSPWVMGLHQAGAQVRARFPPSPPPSNWDDKQLGLVPFRASCKLIGFLQLQFPGPLRISGGRYSDHGTSGHVEGTPKQLRFLRLISNEKIQWSFPWHVGLMQVNESCRLLGPC